MKIYRIFFNIPDIVKPLLKMCLMAIPVPSLNEKAIAIDYKPKNGRENFSLYKVIKFTIWISIFFY